MNAMVFILTTLMNGCNALADPPQGLDKYVLPDKFITCITTHSGGKWEQNNVPYTCVEPLLQSSLHSSKLHEMARVLYEDV